MTTRDAVRTLAHPGFVLALVVLALNDHVLKQAYPGLVTGKLSDVAGLVVAPLLLVVPLTVVRVPRPMIVAIAATGIGFTLTKAFSTGAAITSDLWSLTGVPTQMRADVTDLVALPALYGAWLAHRRTSSRPRSDWRSAAARATGVALLPVAVVATAATSCVPSDGLSSLSVDNGPFPGGGPGREDFLVIETHVVMTARGELTRVEWPEDLTRYLGGHSGDQAGCDSEGTCWRIDPDALSVPSVQTSTDGGRTWQPDLVVTPDARDAALAGLDADCGGTLTADLQDLAVMPDGDTVRVAVAASHAGLYVRTADGVWTLLRHEEVDYDDDMPVVRLSEEPRAVDPVLPPHAPPPKEPEPIRPSEEESLPPEPTCDEPVTVSATPNPQNGPPTTYSYCP